MVDCIRRDAGLQNKPQKVNPNRLTTWTHQLKPPLNGLWQINSVIMLWLPLFTSGIEKSVLWECNPHFIPIFSALLHYFVSKTYCAKKFHDTACVWRKGSSVEAIISGRRGFSTVYFAAQFPSASATPVGANFAPWRYFAWPALRDP